MVDASVLAGRIVDVYLQYNLRRAASVGVQRVCFAHPPGLYSGAADAGADIQADSFRSAGRHARKIRDDGQRQRIKQQKGTDKTHPEKCPDTCHGDVFPLSAVAHRRRRSRGKRICMAGNGAAALESNFKAGLHGSAGNNLCYNNFDSNL